jgi:hypothetical protein
MPSIAILTAHARFPWLRQIAGGGDRIGDWRFTVDRIDPDCALLVVYDEPGAAFETTLPRESRVVFTSEPPGMKTYRPGYLAQFGLIRGPVGAKIEGTEWQRLHPALPWFYGVGFNPGGLVANETADSLLAMRPPEKTRAISVILSKKSNLPKHRARLQLVEHLQARLGDRLRVFGRGFSPVNDKAEAILPFAYHLVLENNDIDHFWTEKTADALLGWSLPIFSGCADLSEDILQGAFIRTDISDPEAVAEQLLRLLDEDPYAGRLSAIAEARKAILTQENLFPILVQLAEERGARSGVTLATPATIQRNDAFVPFAALAGAARSVGRQVRATFKRLGKRE